MSTPYASLEIALGEALLRTTSDAILLADDTSWRVVAFNDAATRLYGSASGRLVGAALETLFKLDGESAVERAIWRARTEPDGLALTIETPEGPRAVRVRARRCESVEGSICVIALQDLTELEALASDLARSKAEQQALLDEVGVGLLVLDSNGRVLRHNRFGPLEEIVGPGLAGRNFFLDVARGDEVRPVFQRFHEWANGFDREAYQETFEFDVGRRTCEAEIYVGTDVGIGVAVVRLVDVTARRKVEEQLRLQAFQAEEAVRHARIAAETAQRLFGSLDTETVLETAATETCRVLGASACQIVEITSDSRVRLLRAVNRSGPIETESFDPDLDANPVVAEVVRVLEPIGVDSVAGHPLAGRGGLLEAVGARSCAAAPVTHDRSLRAVLLVLQRDRARQWSEPELALLGAVGDQLGLALENASVYDALRADRDRSRAAGDLGAAARSAADVDSLLDAAAAFFARVLGPSMFAVHATVPGSGAPVRVWRSTISGDLARDATTEPESAAIAAAAGEAARSQAVAVVPLLDGEAAIAALSSSGGDAGAMVLVRAAGEPRWSKVELELLAMSARVLGPELASLSLLGVVLSAKQMWEKTFDAMSDGIVVHDDSLTIVRVNRAFARLLRVGPGRLVGTRLTTVLDPGNGEIVQRACERVAVSRRSLTFDIDEPALGGTVSISISLLRTTEGVYFIHTIRDITGQRHMQDRLAQASKMASIGRLATGVAHEINTPLATITGCAQSLARQLASIPELTENMRWPAVNDRLTTIVEQSFRCKKITRDLLDFAKPNKASFLPCDLARVAAEAIETVDRDRESSRIALQIRGEPWDAITDPDLVRQILINLIVNALDADEDGNPVTVEVRFLKRLAKLSVRDRGRGIAPNEIERIFDPFYTTKPPGKGTGLGLSISQSLATSLDGRIDVASEPGRGAKFTLTLQRDPNRRTSS